LDDRLIVAHAAAALAVLVLRTIVILHALSAPTDASVADRSGRTLHVRLAGAATISRTYLARRALRVVLAEASDDVALTVAALASLAAVVAVATLLALAGNAELLCLAVLVGVASGVVRLAGGGGHEQSGHKES
jgi:hypothetical protein